MLNPVGISYFYNGDRASMSVSYDFDYWASVLDWDNISNNGWRNGITKIEPSGGTHTQAGDTFSDLSAVILIDGDLVISENIDVNNAGLLVVVSGDITITGNVTNVDGFYIADGKIIIQDTDEKGIEGQINLNGGFVGYGGVELERDLGVGNEVPAEKFNYRPDIIRALAEINQLTIFRFNWREENPLNIQE